MTKKVCSIFQHEKQWCTVVLDIQGKSILKTEVFTANNLEELLDILGDYPITISFNDKAGYLTFLKFPFSGKRKIGMVIREELEDHFPFSLDDVFFDYQEIGQGNVLVASIPKTNIENYKIDKKIKVITLNSIAALYALRWFRIVAERDFLFVGIDRETASIMAFCDGQLCAVRQIVFSGQLDILKNAITDSTREVGFRIDTCYLISHCDDFEIAKSLRLSGIKMKIESPIPADFLMGQVFTSYHWAGIGAALLSIHSKDEINILGEQHVGFVPVEKLTLYLGGSLLLFSLTVAGMLYLNLYFKEKTHYTLNFNQMNVFRSVFPKSPPVKDVVKVIEDRVKSMETDLSGSRIGKETSPLQLLADISSKIDKQIDVKLNEFSFEGNEFVFAGTTVSFASAEKIKKLLEEVEGVKGVEIQNIDLSANQIKFRMRGKI